MNKILLPLFLILFLFLAPVAKVWAAASLSFSPSSSTVTLNQNFSVDVTLSTGGSETDGADVIIRYDGNKLQVVSANLGSLYTNKVVEDTGTSGKITLRATSASNQSYNGTGTLATIVFYPIAEGTANVYFDYTSGSTTDTNIAYQGSDILGSVSNATYTVTSSGTGGTTTSVSPSPSIPVSGTSGPTLALVGGGIALIILGALKFLLF